MARRHAIRPRVRLLIAAALFAAGPIAAAGLAVANDGRATGPHAPPHVPPTAGGPAAGGPGAKGAPPAAYPEPLSPNAVHAVALGAVRMLPAGDEGLAQFEIKGPIHPGLLHLGLRPFPGSVLVTEDDQVLAPVDLQVTDDMLAETVKVEGAGRLWVVTGTTPGKVLQVLAITEPETENLAATSSEGGFPGDAVLEGLTRAAPGHSPAWFGPVRLGPWLVPRRDTDLPLLPGCDQHATPRQLRACAREALASIWDCFANHGMTTRAVPKALAIYLDDRLAFRAVRSSAGGDCSEVLTLKPDRASQERARDIVATAFTAPAASGGGAGDGAAATAAAGAPAPATGSAVATGPAPAPALARAPAAAAPPGAGADAAAEGPPMEMVPADTFPAAGAPASSRREAEVAALMSSLGETCAGRSLLAALRKSPETGLEVSVSLLLHEVAKGVEAWTGRLPDESDGGILEAARALDQLPGGPGCDPVVAVMALTDEWSRSAAHGIATNGVRERFIDAFRDAEKEQGSDLGAWLPGRFPLLHREAKRILDYLG